MPAAAGKPLRAIGLMSGTSLDGVDAAWVQTDGEAITALGPRLTLPYPDELRARLRAIIADAPRLAPDAATVRTATASLMQVHLAAVRALGCPADIIGLHGQTVLHAPHARRTWQLADAAWLAAATSLPVAHDFRTADVAAGGQGAPLVPIFHAALAAALPERPLLVLNLGGVANLTWIGPDGALLACDTGPGNALIDDWVRARTGQDCDQDGALAAAGRADRSLLAALLADPYFARPAPKSLDRQHFAAAITRLDGLSTQDGAATLAAFTAGAVAATALPGRPGRLLVAGGGRHNRALMAALSAAMPCPVAPVEAVGWDGDALEAQCFAYLAVRTARFLPISLPTTTGVPAPMPGGRIASPPAPR